MNLNFVIPGQLIWAILFLLFILRAIVALRAAATHDIDDEKCQKYSTDSQVAKRTCAVSGIIMAIFASALVVLYFLTRGAIPLFLMILIALIAFPGFFEEILIIRRCQAGRRN